MLLFDTPIGEDEQLALWMAIEKLLRQELIRDSSQGISLSL